MSESLKRADQETSTLEAKVLDGRPLHRMWKVRKTECGSLAGCDEIASTYVNKVTRKLVPFLERKKIILKFCSELKKILIGESVFVTNY